MAAKKFLRRAVICGLVLVVAGMAGGVPRSGRLAVVDVNRATVAELMTVPEMTEVWARRIVRFRPYRRKTDLVDHGVISAEEYGKIRDYVVAHRMADERDKPSDAQ